MPANAAALVALAAPLFLAQPDGEAEGWRGAEFPMLTRHVQLTHPHRFAKAGEAYFNPDVTWIIFQAVPRPPEGEEPDPHYSMYVAKLTRDEAGEIDGIEDPIRISPPGSANTCGFFHPSLPHAVIFGSTIRPPTDEAPAGYQRDTSKYAWKFPTEMEVCSRIVPALAQDKGLKILIPNERLMPDPVFERPGGYDAECAYSPDGRHIVFSSHDPETNNADLFVHDTATGTTTRVVAAPGYDGGPFFSPDGTRICYRSDRVGNELLQIYVADLTFDAVGTVTGISREYQLTDDRHVNWAPYWHPSGEHLVFATSRQGHRNYEVYSIEVPPTGFAPPPDPDRTLERPGEPASDVEPVPTTRSAGNLPVPTVDCAGVVGSKRITHAPGFDGLPVFSPDGAYMMWTSQRGLSLPKEARASSQIWIARAKYTAPE